MMELTIVLGKNVRCILLYGSPNAKTISPVVVMRQNVGLQYLK